MPRYVAFLRAINVGGHIVKMDRLRKLFTQLGLTDVETFIASGNVLFTSPSKSGPALEKKIEKHLNAALGYEVATFVRTAAEVCQAAAHEPFSAALMKAPYHDLYVSFLRNAPPSAAQRAVEALRSPNDEFHINARELYWLSRVPFSESKVGGALLEKILGMPATMRSVTSGAEARGEVRGRGEVNAPGWVGVDFGTTNSAVAVVDEAGAAHLVSFPSAAGPRATFPSVLYFEKRSHSVAGAAAIEHYLASETKGRFIQSLKAYLADTTFEGTGDRLAALHAREADCADREAHERTAAVRDRGRSRGGSSSAARCTSRFRPMPSSTRSRRIGW